jgi:hypothetical protein
MSFYNAEELLNKYKSNTFQNYLEKISNLQTYKNDIGSRKKNKRNKVSVSYKEDSKSISIINGNIKIYIIKPKYKYVFFEIDKIQKDLDKLIIDYHNHKYNIIHSIKNDEKYFKEHDKIIKDIQIKESQISELVKYYIDVNSYASMKHNDYGIQIHKLIKEKKNIIEDIKNEKDTILMKKKMKNYISLLNDINDYKEKIKSYPNIDYIIITLPSINDKGLEKIVQPWDNNTSEIQIKGNTKSIEDKINSAIKKGEKKMAQKIKDAIDNTPIEVLENYEDKVISIFLSKFKFKNKKQCASTKKNEPYYMKKSDIIDTIKKEPKLKSHMPDKFETLKKNELCDKLFD